MSSSPAKVLHRQIGSENNPLKNLLLELSLLFLSSILFALSFPSFISVWGWFPLAFISLAPVFIVLHRSNWLKVFLYGILYGYVSYALFNYWASTFHPLAIIILPSVYAVYFFLVFPLLKLADQVLPRYGYLLQLLVWIAYEYLRTTGFLGYPYGIMGYSQYLFLPLIQISEITGVWGVSFLVVFPSVYLGHALKNGFSGFRDFVRRHSVAPVVYGLLFCASVVFGLFAETDYSHEPHARVALIQHNSDTWEGGEDAYERNLKTLIRLSRESMKENPDIVIWSETAFVPGVDWHSRYRTNRRLYQLVKEFKDFMATQDIPYVTGNDDGQLEPNEEGKLERVDYNAVFLYYEGELKQTYRKIHLVPFTENFPYKKQFPNFYQILVDHDYHFWKKGEEYTVFQGPDFSFSTPICFEDVFGYLSRRFVLEGAQVIVNVTNDSWSGSEAAQMQHMAMAVFRSIENRRTMVRSANSGMTCTIEPSGKITALLEPFIEGYLVEDIPIFDGVTTWYTKTGDWLGIGSVFAGIAWLAVAVLLYFLRRRKGKVN